MRWAFAVIVGLHGLIHLMGFAKAFGLADLPQLSQAISKPMGLLWLAACVLSLAAVVTLFVRPQIWWILGAAAAVTSQIAIFSAWQDARFGTIANLLLLAGAAYGYLTQGPTSFAAEMKRELGPRLASSLEAPLVQEADLAPLPDPVQRYLRLVGVVGQPRVRNYALRFSGRIRGGPEDRWMPFVATQQSFTAPPARFFLMRARMRGLPVHAFHRLDGGHATMRVRALGAIPVADARGEVMDQAESVTLLNDMCLLAPGTLLDPALTWEAIDARTARVRLEHGGHSVSATLHFDARGLLRDFVSDDRYQIDPGGGAPRKLRFSTPVTAYARFGSHYLASHAEGRWHAPEGEYAYGEFEVLDAAFNVR
ncbi:MAG: hypothetical protein H6744_09525 [Deltaproteobacteria bacterium]|nr:hypothetical protein [Deltaproteobacteria bacterium]